MKHYIYATIAETSIFSDALPGAVVLPFGVDAAAECASAVGCARE